MVVDDIVLDGVVDTLSLLHSVGDIVGGATTRELGSL